MILVISSKTAYSSKRLIAEARKQNIGLTVMDMSGLIACKFKVSIKDFDALYVRNPYLKGSPKYLPQIIKLAKKFKLAGKKVVDANIAKGNIGQGKWKDYQILKKANISIPKTKQYISNPYTLIPTPSVLKWIYGFKAMGTFFIKSANDVAKIPSYIPKKELMQQEFIDADFEYKVVTVGYKSISKVLRFKTNPQNHRPDFKTATAVPSVKFKQVCALAEKAAKVLGRELSKIDILEKDGVYYVLEVNRFPGLESFEELTKFNVFEEFLKYLQKA